MSLPRVFSAIPPVIPLAVTPRIFPLMPSELPANFCFNNFKGLDEIFQKIVLEFLEIIIQTCLQKPRNSPTSHPGFFQQLSPRNPFGVHLRIFFRGFFQALLRDSFGDFYRNCFWHYFSYSPWDSFRNSPRDFSRDFFREFFQYSFCDSLRNLFGLSSWISLGIFF